MIRTLAIGEFVPAATDTIWDVRDTESYRAGHIAQAVNKPLDALTADDLAQTTGTIYVLCGGGTKAAKAAEKLHSFDETRDIVHLTGGTRGAVALGWQLMVEA